MSAHEEDVAAPANERGHAARRDYARTGLVTHDEARQALSRFNASHFNNKSEHARYSVPANPRRDDDFLLDAYIARCRQLEAAATEVLKNARECFGEQSDPLLKPLVEFFKDPTWRRQ